MNELKIQKSATLQSVLGGVSMNHSDSYTNFMNKGNMIKAKISMPSGFLDYNKLNSGEDKVKKNIQNLNPVGIKT